MDRGSTELKYKNFIWDWDGTLFDSYPVMQKNFRLCLADYGIHMEESALLWHMKQALKDYVEKIAKERHLSSQEILNNYKQRGKENENAENLRPFAGIAELLSALREKGARHFVYTHRDRAALHIAAAYGIDKYFDGWLCQGDLGFERKPGPGGILHILQSFSLKKEESVMLGDREIDILSARNAGIDGILFLPDGYPVKMEDVPSAFSPEALLSLLGA